MKYSSKSISDKLIYLYILCLPISWVSLAIGSVYRIFMIFALVIYIIAMHGKLPIINNYDNMFKLWVFLFAYEAITIVWAVDKNASINSIFTLATTFSLVIICVGNTTIKSEHIEKCWSFVGVVASLLFLFGTRVNVGYGTRQTLVLLGTSTDANEFAGLFVITIPFLVQRILDKECKLVVRIVFGFLAIIEIYVILMTGSRGALYAFAVSMVVLTLYGKMTFKKLFLITIALSILMFIVVNFVVPKIPTATFARFSLNTLLTDKGTGRSDIWAQGFSNYLSGSIIHILFGYGTDGILSLVFGKYTSTMHNTILQVLFNYGIVGAVIFVILLVKIYKKVKELNVCYLSALIGITIMSMTITMSCIYKPFWVFLITSSFLLPNHSSDEE